MLEYLCDDSKSSKGALAIGFCTPKKIAIRAPKRTIILALVGSKCHRVKMADVDAVATAQFQQSLSQVSDAYRGVFLYNAIRKSIAYSTRGSNICRLSLRSAFKTVR